MAEEIKFKNNKTEKYKDKKGSSSKRINRNDSFLSTSKISNNTSSSLNNKIDSLIKTNNGKTKYKYHIQSKKHPKCSSCLHNYNKNLERNKSALSDYILNNELTKQKYYYHQNIKLLGNSRYKYSNPLLFVKDQENNISNSKLGLIPIPFEKYKKKIKDDEDEKENKNLYELQRSIVWLRRRQYNNNYKNKKRKNKNNDFYNIDYINKIG